MVINCFQIEQFNLYLVEMSVFFWGGGFIVIYIGEYQKFAMSVFLLNIMQPY